MHKLIAGITVAMMLLPIPGLAQTLSYDSTNGLDLGTGATVNEFSVDGTLAGNSDSAVPTEKAVKTYVDGSTGSLIVNMPDFSSPSETTAPTVSAVKEFVNTTSPGTNYIICGGFEKNCWPQETSYTSIADDTYGPATFQYHVSSDAAVMDLSQDTGTTEADQKSEYSVKLDTTTVDSSITGGEHVALAHWVTGYDLAKMWGKEVTLSFWVKAVKTGTYCVSFRNESLDRSLVKEYTINATNTWEEKQIMVTLDESTGSWTFDEGPGLNITFTIAAGSTLQGTAGSWTSSNIIATSSQVNGVDSTDNNFQLDLAKLEIGDTATRWTPYVWNENIKNVEWFIERIEPLATWTIIGTGHVFNQSLDEIHYYIPIMRKREEPTQYGYDTTNVGTNYQHQCGSVTNSFFSALNFDLPGLNGMRIYDQNATGSVPATNTQCRLWMKSPSYIDIDARVYID